VRGGDPLVPVIVLVPGPLARLHVRRALGRLGGVAAIDVLTAADLAQRVAAPVRAEAGTLALPAGGWEEAVRVTLLADPGPFRTVVHHPAAVVEVARALQRLRPATAPERAAVASTSGPGRRAEHLVRLLAAVEGSLAGWHDRGGAGPAAGAALAAGADPGPVLAFCPRGVDPGELDLLGALAARGRLGVVAAVTGDAVADESVRALVERLGGPGGWAPVVEGRPEPVPDHLVLAPDAEAEGRLVVQQVVAALENGVAGHDIAVVTFGRQAGISRLGDLLDSAGVPWSGPVGRTLACTPSGRALLGLLGLEAEGWTHAGVLAALSSAPLRRGAGNPGPLPLGRWAALARDANVVGGREQWQKRPALLADRLRRRRGDATAAELDDLAAFALSLAALLTPPLERSWTALARWALAVLDDLVAPDRTWSPDATLAHPAVRAAVAGLAELDGVVASSAAPGPPELVAALETALAAAAPRRGRVGRGVLLATDAADIQGATPRLLLLAGVVEGAAPARRSDDPLLPDAEMAMVHGDASRAVRRAAERAAVLSAVAAAGRTVAFAHRADAQATRRPSRWFLGWAGVLARSPSPFGADELEHAAGPWLTVVPSFTAATSGPVAGSLQERRLAALAMVLNEPDGKGLLRTPLVAGHLALARAVTATVARRSNRFTAWDGLLGPGLRLDAEVSASALEEWSACPQRYLLNRHLGVASTVAPTDALEVGGQDRGSLAHQVLAAVVRRGLGRQPSEPWSEKDREFLRNELHRRAEALRLDGRLGTGVLAELRIDELEAALLAALEDDDAIRADEGWVPAAVEEGFGDEAGRPVSVTLPSGRVLRFQGRIDRVDAADGRVRVIDYKTGKARKQLEAASGGAAAARLLQLGVYEAAAGAAHPGAAVSSAWWLLEARGKDGSPILANQLGPDGFAVAVDAIADGIEGGVFPADAGKDEYRGFQNCRFCAYDRVCRVDRVRALQRVADDPALAPWRALRAVGEAVAEENGGGVGEPT